MIKPPEKVVEMEIMREMSSEDLQYQYFGKLKNMVDVNRHF